MESDSESQDSDDGRRFRFETTRKDAASISQLKTRISPKRDRHKGRRLRSRDRSSRDDRFRHSKDDSSHKSRSSNDKDASSKLSSKEKKSSSRDSSSKRSLDKESRIHRIKDSRGHDLKEPVKDHKDHSNSKHKSKSREKHKKHSRDRSREKSNHVIMVEESSKKEDKRTFSETSCTPMDIDKVKEEKCKILKKQSVESSIKINRKNLVKETESSSNLNEISDITSRSAEIKEISPPRKKTKSFFDRVVNKKINDNDSSIYGPTLPPQLEKKMINAKAAEMEKTKSSEKIEAIDIVQVSKPTLSPCIETISIENTCDINEKEEQIINLTEEKQFKKDKTVHNKNKEEAQEGKEIDEEEIFGPALPPSMKRSEIVGPKLPENFIIPSNTCNTIEIEKSDNEDDNDFVGPLPADHPAARNSDVQMKLEYRAKYVKAKFRDKTSPDKNKREEWMVELPPAHAVALGLGTAPRKFKTREGPDMSDRSMWTDTPVDRLRKQKEKEENRFIPSEEASKKSKISKDKHTLKEPVEEKKVESLLDMHLKTLKKKKKKLEKEAKELGLPTRRPFDREIDLQVNQLDDARKKKIFEKASRLNDRFTSGKI